LGGGARENGLERSYGMKGNKRGGKDSNRKERKGDNKLHNLTRDRESEIDGAKLERRRG